MEWKKIQTIIANVLQLNMEEITEDADLVVDLGADSLEIFQIVTEMEREFDLSLTATGKVHDHTVGGLYQLVLSSK